MQGKKGIIKNYTCEYVNVLVNETMLSCSLHLLPSFAAHYYNL